MCRHALFNKAGLDLINKEYGGIKYYLDFLIKERGGNGNGLALIKDGVIFKFKKDLNYSLDQIVLDLEMYDFDWALFHTRLATIGPVVSENCHPFLLDMQTAVSMNGTEVKYSEERDDDRHGGMTDAERVIFSFFKSNLSPKDFFINTGLDSAYLGFFKGKPFVSSNYGPIMRFIKKDNAIIFGSDFPWRYNGKNMFDIITDDFYWEEGSDIDYTKTKVAFTDNLCLIDGLARQLFDKTFDTLITLLSQKCGIYESDLNNNYSVYEILNMCREFGLIAKENILIKRNNK